jgi:hypothetical protein
MTDLNSLANLRSMRYGDQSAELAQIQSARNALRILDTEITRTELRLRNLPRLAPSWATGGRGAGTAEQRLAARSQPRKGGFSKALLPVKVDRGGLGLNPGFMKYAGKGATASLGFHITAALGQQLMDMGEQMKAVRQAGGSQSEQAMVPVLGTGRKLVEATGATSFAKMLLRGGGLTREDADARVDRVMDRWFTPPSILAQRDRKQAAAISKALEGVTARWKEDVAFLDNWTPEDFDVYGDPERAQLKADLHKRNRAYLDALADMRSNEAARAAAKNAD